MPIAEIALKLGYRDVGYFTRAFHGQIGRSRRLIERDKHRAWLGRTERRIRGRPANASSIIRMSGNAFCSRSLDVFSSIPVRETVRESLEAGVSPSVRFQAPSGWAAALG